MTEKTFTRDQLADILNHHLTRYFITVDSYGLAHYLKHGQGDTIICCQIADALGLEHDWESTVFSTKERGNTKGRDDMTEPPGQVAYCDNCGKAVTQFVRYDNTFNYHICEQCAKQRQREWEDHIYEKDHQQ